MTQEEFTNEARRLRPRLLKTARHYLTDEDAEDIVQDALLRLWQMLGQLHAPVDSLALVLTRNLCVSQLRRQHVYLPLAEEQAGATADIPTTDERIDRLMPIVEALPPLQQTIFRLRHIEGMKMAEIAALTGSSEVAVRKSLSRARQSVRQLYMKKYEQ